VSELPRVVLFSPFSPDLGGGGTNLRTLLPLLEGVRVDWLYTAAQEARQPDTIRVGPPLAGGPVWRDLAKMSALWAGLPTPELRNVLGAITSRGTSRYWVVGHNEGIVVARALAATGARVHLTIQDDVPDGIFGRSQRYRLFGPPIRPTFEATLRRMASIDVTSDGMQRYYQSRLGVTSDVVHPVVTSLPSAPPIPAVSDEIRMGHLGSIYSPAELRTALRGLRIVAAERGLRARVVMIGLAPKFHPDPREFGDLVELVSDLPEPAAVERLFSCHFLYAMYPFDDRSDVFRRTSLPTKLTSYLRCQRPILAHSPPGSSLLELVERHGLGVACHGQTPQAFADAVRTVLRAPPAAGVYEAARAAVYDVDNARRLSARLQAL
jgi:hypothetical protein